MSSWQHARDEEERASDALAAKRRASPRSILSSGEGYWVFQRQSEDVFSYFKFIIPVEEKKAPNKMTYTKALAYLLVFGSIFLQFTMLYAIFHKVVYGDIKWQRKVLNPQGEGFGSSPGGGLGFLGATPVCNPGGSLCFKLNGTVSCAPPSVQLTGRWDELDVDGDGTWTRDEVEASKEELQCKYAVNPVEVFDVFVTFLLGRENVLWIHPDVRAGKAIPKAYFTYAAGDIIMCGYRSTDMCANVLRMGAFDAPLKYGTAPRVGETIDAALAYCYALLKPGGICERTLPSTYAVWRKNGEELCGEPDYDPWVYKHPVTGRSKSMLVVDYDARKNYDRAHGSLLFLIYKTVIIGLFCLAILVEMKDTVNLMVWTVMFPSAREYGEDAVLAEKDEDDKLTYTVQGISTSHRITMAFLSTIRLVALMILVFVGLSFLLKDTDYVDLLLNAVGFVFIIEVAAALYMLVDQTLRDEFEDIESMKVPIPGNEYLARNPALRDILSCVGLVVVVICIMLLHHGAIVRPMWQALECTCLSQGENCLEAGKFTPGFWENYWTVEVPKVFDDVAVMRLEAEAAGGAAAQVMHHHRAPHAAIDTTWHLARAKTHKHSAGHSSQTLLLTAKSTNDAALSPPRRPEQHGGDRGLRERVARMLNLAST
mmetsp:Transcript_69379/g.178823  ORF Transcript_69379/g.178823 Transcript_69379/m.178823 type:complete len:654 (-) Transcript_69379:41-2002(-)